MTAIETPPTDLQPTAPRRSPSATATATAAALAQLALAAEVVVAETVLAGAPNPGMAAVAVLPLAAAILLWRGHRAGAVLALVAVATAVGLRLVGLPFDLVRPEALGPFVLSALQVLTAGIAGSTAVAALRSSRAVAARSLRLVVAAGIVLGGVLAAGLLVGNPQGDRTGSATPEQIEAAPTVQMVNYRFEPAQLRGQAGAPVTLRFTNPSDDSHTFTVADLDLEVEVPSGRTRTVVVEASPGEYRFTCTAGSHLEDGMEGRLVITGSAGTDGDGAAATEHGAHSHG